MGYTFCSRPKTNLFVLSINTGINTVHVFLKHSFVMVRSVRVESNSHCNHTSLSTSSMITLSFDSDNKIVESDDKFHNSVKKCQRKLKPGRTFICLFNYFYEGKMH